MARERNDDYPTPGPLVRLIVDRLARDNPRPSTILEPSCGSGRFMRACRQVWPDAQVTGVEINPDHVQACRDRGLRVHRADMLAVDRERLGRFDLIVGNPPYSLAEPFIRRLRACMNPDGWLVFLLRLNFLGGQRRYGRLWAKWPATRVYCLPHRPSFKTGENKTDMTEYGVFCWRYPLEPERHVEVTWLDNRHLSPRSKAT
jgi:spermidine synthase